MKFIAPVAMLAAMGYVGWHLKMLPHVACWLQWLLPTIEVACVAMAIISLTQWLDRMPMGIARFVYNVGNKSLIVMLYLFMVFLVVDILRMVHVLPTTWTPGQWWVSSILLALMTVLFVGGSIHYRHKKRVVLEVESHGKTLVDTKPTTIVAVSDLHLGYHNRRKELSRWVDLINAEHPDAVLITGDLIDHSLRPVLGEDMAAELRRIEAPVYACMGNHEYYAERSMPGAVDKFFADSDIKLLQDSSVALPFGIIIGRDDRTNRHRSSVEQLTSALPDSAYKILLDHQPYHLEEAENAGIDLQISGHTHRGQVWPLSWVTDAVYECSWGYHRRGTTDYYVSSGLGIWGAKYRIGTQSEYLVVKINK